jgi:hypothetical protein
MIAHFSDSDVFFFCVGEARLEMKAMLVSRGDLQTSRRGENEKEILDLFSIAMEFNLAYKKDSFHIPFYYYF